jgi:hypothetical protein
MGFVQLARGQKRAETWERFGMHQRICHMGWIKVTPTVRTMQQLPLPSPHNDPDDSKCSVCPDIKKASTQSMTRFKSCAICVINRSLK